jgi:hypothetical protein
MRRLSIWSRLFSVEPATNAVLSFGIGLLSFSFSVLVFRHWNRATDQSSFFFVLSAAFFLSAVGALFVSSRTTNRHLTFLVAFSSIMAFFTFLRPPPRWEAGFPELAPLVFFSGTILCLGFAQAAAFTLSPSRAKTLMCLTLGSLVGCLSLPLLDLFALTNVVRLFVVLGLGISFWVLFPSRVVRLAGLPLVAVGGTFFPLKDYDPLPQYKSERTYSNSLSLVKVVKLDGSDLGVGNKNHGQKESFRFGSENINFYTLFRNSKESSLLYDIGDEKSLSFLAQTMNYRLVALAPTGSRVAIVGSGGGSEIQAALLAGAASVTAIEINPLMVQAARDFSRRPDLNYDSPKVRTVIDDAAHYFRHLGAEEKFDLIMMSGVRYYGSSAPRVFNEDHVNTKEAFSAMIRQLRPDGFLVHRSGGQGTGFRNLIAATLKSVGESYPEAQIYMGYYRDKNSAELRFGRSGFLIVFKPSPFSGSEIAYLQAAAFGTSRSKVFGMTDPTPSLTGPIATESRPFALWISQNVVDSAYVPLFWGLLSVVVVLIALTLGTGTGLRSLQLTSYAFLSGFLFMGAELYFFWWGDLISGKPAVSASVVAFALLAATAAGNGWAWFRKSISLSWALTGSILWLGLTWPLSKIIYDQMSHAISALAAYVVIVSVFGFFSGVAFGRFVGHSELVNPKMMKTAIACNGLGGLIGAIGLKVVSLYLGYAAVLGALVFAILMLLTLVQLMDRQRRVI